MPDIIDLNERDDLVSSVAELLMDGFSDTGATCWTTTDQCLTDVRRSLHDDKLSRVALSWNGDVLGWATGGPIYEGLTWELEVLVVERTSRHNGIGAELLKDFEERVVEKKGLNVFLGTDDENSRTSLGGKELYPEPLQHLANIRNIGGHPFEFYQKQGYSLSGILPDANGPGKPDIFMTKRLG